MLNFPVLVTVQAGDDLAAPPLELRVMALVAPPCPLTLSPHFLDLGHVTTQETVSSELHITNHHHSCAYQFAFLHLPQVANYTLYYNYKQQLSSLLFFFRSPSIIIIIIILLLDTFHYLYEKYETLQCTDRAYHCITKRKL